MGKAFDMFHGVTVEHTYDSVGHTFTITVPISHTEAKTYCVKSASFDYGIKLVGMVLAQRRHT